LLGATARATGWQLVSKQQEWRSMDRDQLADLTRRAVKLARDKTTDLTPSEHSVAANT